LNTLIPLEYYTVSFYNFLLLVVFFVLLKSNSVSIQDANNLKSLNFIGLIIIILIIPYIGLRPVSGYYFGDMRTYSLNYELYAAGEPIGRGKDEYFEYFMKWCSGVMSQDMFFLICSFFYIYPMYLFSKKVFKDYWFYSFFILILSFSFWGYGTNGIRNGIGTSLFLLAISLKKITNTILVFLVALLVHKSSLIIGVIFLSTFKLKNPKWAIYFWLLCIPLSLALGSFWEGFFLNLGFGEETRIEGYLSDEENEFQELFSKLGFRWDFLLYSATGVATGYYFIYKKKFEDLFYNQIYNFYLIANGFWILVIRATFSNRFSYLSWFILGIVIIYPFLKMRFFNKQHLMVGRVLFIYFFFTYVMNVVLAVN
jgi:EpsG family